MIPSSESAMALLIPACGSTICCCPPLLLEDEELEDVLLSHPQLLEPEVELHQELLPLSHPELDHPQLVDDELELVFHQLLLFPQLLFVFHPVFPPPVLPLFPIGVGHFGPFMYLLAKLKGSFTSLSHTM